MASVLLFKSESEGPDKFLKILEENDFTARSINCLSFQFKNLEQLKAKLNHEDDYQGLILTSQRSVHALLKATLEDENVMNKWTGKSNYSVGESTADLAQERLKISTRGRETGNAQSLAALIAADQGEQEPFKKPFLFPSGNLKQDVLEKSLKSSSIEVESVEVYETIANPNLAKSIEELDIKLQFVVFFSPSGVKFTLPIFKSLAITTENLKFIAIGPSTKACLEENGLQCFKMCAKPSPDSLLDVLKN
jgi:uroporphyrinogen-III synthase